MIFTIFSTSKQYILKKNYTIINFILQVKTNIIQCDWNIFVIDRSIIHSFSKSNLINRFEVHENT